MTKYKLEYVWLDGNKPIPELRGKTTIKSFEKPPVLADLPLWGFDGSSTKQAEGRSSDCVLKPVAAYPDSTRTNGVLVMCEVMMPDGVTPQISPRSPIGVPASPARRGNWGWREVTPSDKGRFTRCQPHSYWAAPLWTRPVRSS